MTGDIMLRSALGYAERLGWPAFPLAGKVPAGGRGFLDATTDAAAVRAMWDRHPAANIGVSCIGSGFLAVDVDPRNGGDATLAKLEECHGALPRTVRQLTGGGGQHILFAGSDAWQVPPRGSLGAGIDVKWRGYIVAAPSVHPETGRRYAWMPDHHPLACAIAPLPDWMVEKLFPAPEPRSTGEARPAIEDDRWGPSARYSRRALERACEAVAAAPVGQQDATLIREAFSIGTLVAGGHMPAALACDALIWAGCQMHADPHRRPWRQSEISEKVARAFTRAAACPRSPRAAA